MKLNGTTSTNRLNKPLRITAADKKPCKAPAMSARKRAARRSEPIALLPEHNQVVHAPVVFNCFKPTAGQVFVAGAFNDWQPDRTPLEKQANGVWSVELLLKPGTYEYRFVIDGLWEEDPLAPRFTGNPFGGLNSVLVVEG
jgi:1,4-alpha-glucan branching enzyme